MADSADEGWGESNLIGSVAAGRYRVEGRYGLMNVRAVREVEVKAGQTQQLVFEQEVAALRLRITGSGPTDVAWIIHDQAGKAVWTGAHVEAVANLQAGRYVVTAETRNKREERAVDLRAGEAKLLEFSGPADEQLSRYFREHRELGR